MRCNPSGVQFEPSVCPMPKREVEQQSFLRKFTIFEKGDSLLSDADDENKTGWWNAIFFASAKEVSGSNYSI